MKDLVSLLEYEKVVSQTHYLFILQSNPHRLFFYDKIIVTYITHHDECDLSREQRKRDTLTHTLSSIFYVTSSSYDPDY
jgi:hypothetical protein